MELFETDDIRLKLIAFEARVKNCLQTTTWFLKTRFRNKCDTLHKEVISTQIGHFTVAYSVTGPINGSEAAGDLVLIRSSLFLSCKLCCCEAN